MINKADHDLIDRYIKGQLSEKEIEVFNGKLENNEFFSDTYQKQLLMIDLITEAMDDEDVKRKIENSIEKRKINSMAIRMMFPRLAAAVAVILLISAAGIYLLRNTYVQKSDYQYVSDQLDSTGTKLSDLENENHKLLSRNKELNKLLKDSNEIVRLFESDRNLLYPGNLMGAGKKIDFIELTKPGHEKILSLNMVKNGVEFSWISKKAGNAVLVVHNLNFNNRKVYSSEIQLNKQSHCGLVSGFGVYQWYIILDGKKTERQTFTIVPNSEK